MPNWNTHGVELVKPFYYEINRSSMVKHVCSFIVEKENKKLSTNMSLTIKTVKAIELIPANDSIKANQQVK